MGSSSTGAKDCLLKLSGLCMSFYNLCSVVLSLMLGPAQGKEVAIIFCGEILLEALHTLGGVLLSNNRRSVLFAMPHAAHIEHHFLLWQDVVLPTPYVFCSSSLPRPWVAQDTLNGTICLFSGC